MRPQLVIAALQPGTGIWRFLGLDIGQHEFAQGLLRNIV